VFRDPFTLIVALDGEGHASGDLYVDDGMSFKFAKGEFVPMHFTFSAGVVTLRRFNPTQNPSPFGDGYDVLVERIRVTCLEEPPVAVKGSTGGRYETDFRKGVLTIHRVNLSVAEDRALGLEFEGRRLWTYTTTRRVSQAPDETVMISERPVRALPLIRGYSKRLIMPGPTLGGLSRPTVPGSTRRPRWPAGAWRSVRARDCASPSGPSGMFRGASPGPVEQRAVKATTRRAPIRPR